MQAQYIAHHGIKGQKWGVRRYQNPDGSLTAEGKERYHKEIDRRLNKTKALVTAFGAYAGGIAGRIGSVGLLATGSTAVASLNPAVLLAGGAIVGAAAAYKLTKKDLEADAEEQHMYIESGKYFMQQSVGLKMTTPSQAEQFRMRQTNMNSMRMHNDAVQQHQQMFHM